MDKAMIEAKIKAKMAAQQAAVVQVQTEHAATGSMTPTALLTALAPDRVQDAPNAPNAPTTAPDRFQGLASAYAGRRAGDVLRLPDGRVATLRGWRHVAGAMVALLVDADGACIVAGRLDMARAHVMIPAGDGSAAKRGSTTKPGADTGGVKVGGPVPVGVGGPGGVAIGGGA